MHFLNLLVYINHLAWNCYATSSTIPQSCQKHSRKYMQTSVKYCMIIYVWMLNISLISYDFSLNNSLPWESFVHSHLNFHPYLYVVPKFVSISKVLLSAAAIEVFIWQHFAPLFFSRVLVRMFIFLFLHRTPYSLTVLISDLRFNWILQLCPAIFFLNV